MNKEFIPYKEALALKELGFDEPCIAFYTVIPEDEINWFTIPEQGITDKTSFGSSKNYNSKYFEEEGTISAPTFSQAFRWFREEYDITQTIARDGSLAKEGAWAYTIIYKSIYFNDGYLTYEEAELACLIKLIEIVKKK
jgi:hypothetical protein